MNKINLLYKKAVSIVILTIVTLIVYIPFLNNWFSPRDDKWMLINNRQVLNLNFSNIYNYFTNFYHGQYSPLNTLYYGIVYHFFGLEPFWYNLGSLIFHILNTILVFLFIHKLLLAKNSNSALKNFSEKEIKIIAFLVAFLFGIHPIQIEAVIWISASKILLFSFFFLIGMISYLHYCQFGKRKFYWFSLIAFILSLLSKEQSVVFPFLIILIDLFIQRKLIDKKVLLEKIPFFLISGCFCYVSLLAQDQGFHNVLEYHYYPLWQRFFLANFSFVEYIFKLIMPINLSNFYRFPMKVGEPLPLKYYFYPIITSVIFWVLYTIPKQKKMYLIFGLAFYFINLILSLHVIPMARKSLIADRYLYLSSIGIFFIAIVLFFYMIKKQTGNNRKLFILVLSFYCISMISYTIWRNYF